MVGIILADKEEVHDFPFDLITTKKIGQFEFVEYKFNHKKVVLVVSGIGKANAAAATQSMIENYEPFVIINYGAVGATNKLKLFDLVHPQKIFYGDVETPWYEPGTLPGEKSYFRNKITGKRKNNLATQDSFIVSNKKINEISQKFKVDIFDMEAAAIAQICEKCNVGFYVAKAVSDIVNVNDVMDLDSINENIKKASKIAFDWAVEWIQSY